MKVNRIGRVQEMLKRQNEIRITSVKMLNVKKFHSQFFKICISLFEINYYENVMDFESKSCYLWNF